MAWVLKGMCNRYEGSPEERVWWYFHWWWWIYSASKHLYNINTIITKWLNCFLEVNYFGIKYHMALWRRLLDVIEIRRCTSNMWIFFYLRCDVCSISFDVKRNVNRGGCVIWRNLYIYLAICNLYQSSSLATFSFFNNGLEVRIILCSSYDSDCISLLDEDFVHMRFMYCTP